MVESGGDPNAHNTNIRTGDNSYGLWQINMLGKLAPERLVLFGIRSNNELFDPQTNARAMRILSANGADFTPWSAFNSDAYKRFLDMPVTDQTKDPWWKTILNGGLGGVIPGYGARGLVPGVGGITDVTQGVGSLVETVNKSAGWISNSENWVRVGYVLGGSVMIIVGLTTMISSTSVGAAAMNLVPTGRVANLAKKGMS